MFRINSILRAPDDTQLGSFPGGSGAPDTSFNPFDSSAGAPPAPTNADGSPREVRDPVTRTVEPVRTQEPAQQPPVQRQQAPAQTQQQAPVAPVVPPVTGQQVVMTDAQLQQLAHSMRPAPVAAAPVVAPQMTDDEFAKKFNIHKTTPEEYEAILGIKPDSPARVAALDAALQAVSRQSVTISRALMEQMREELGLQVQPAREFMLQQQAREHHQMFVTNNPDLKDYTPLLQELVVSTKAKIDRGELPNFKSPQEAAQFVATQARKLLNLQAPQPGQAQQQQQRQSPVQQGGSRSMSTTSMGGRTGQSGGAAPVQGLAERLFAEQNT